MTKDQEIETTCTTPNAANLPTWTPRTDVRETEEGMVITMDLPGVAKADLEIELENRSLRISGNAPTPLPSGMQWLRQERRARQYGRTFRLSARIDEEKLNATLSDGVLTVHLPFTLAAKPRKIEISE